MAIMPTEWIHFQKSLKDLVHSNNMMMLQKAGMLVKIAQNLEKAGFPFISLKGPVLSQILHGNLTTKASIDLDILIQENDWEAAVSTLYEMGFVQSKYQFELNKPQKKYLFKHFHHLGFYHPGGKISLELHWQLNTNKYLLKWEFEELYWKSVMVEVGGKPIHTLAPVETVVHLMVHGAHHAWSRLDWLLEFALALTKYQHLYAGIISECRTLGLDSLFLFSSRISNIVFNTTFPENKKANDDFKIRFCIDSINAAQVADYTKPLLRVRQKLYLSQFKTDLRYKVQVWLALRTNMLDWQTLKLPPRLFFLYYLLRPFMVIYNRKS